MSIISRIADAIDRAIAETPINWRQVAVNFVLSPLVALWSVVAICALCNQRTVDITGAAWTASACLACGFTAGAAAVVSVTR